MASEPQTVAELGRMLNSFMQQMQTQLANIDRRLETQFISRDVWDAEHKRLQDRVEIGERERAEIKRALFTIATGLVFPLIIAVVTAFLLAK